MANVYPHINIVDLPIKDPPLYPQIQILKYMGNKRKLLSWLLPHITGNIDKGDTLLDLFSGTSSVGYALKSEYNIIANDIQTYAYTIARAILQFNSSFDYQTELKEIKKNFIRNKNKLLKYYGEAINYEDELINNKDINLYLEYIENIPRYSYEVQNDIFNLKHPSSFDNIVNYKKNPRKFPFILFSTYFPNTFFSLKQCVEIDSLRYAIEKHKNIPLKDVLFSSLMFAISKTVNSSGHFAEYLHFNSDKSTKLVFEHRSISVYDAFLKKLNEFTRLNINKDSNNDAYNLDWKECIHELTTSGRIKDVKLIYIDPPYTTAQYSRYYHIPETLVKYDYPEVTINQQTNKIVKGVYRNDRVQSEFSQTKIAKKAFYEMFDIIASVSDAKLVISYSDNSILTLTDIIDMAKKYYNTTDVFNGYVHSAQGSKFSKNGKGNLSVYEYVVICEKK